LEATDRRDVHEKSGKASFGHIYDRQDPREYFRTLGSMDYRIPDHGQRLFGALVERQRGEGEDPVNVVDLCCSYGINAALLKYDVTLDDLYERYCSEELGALSGDELAEGDAAYYAGRAREAAPRVTGLDVAENAVSYALRAGCSTRGRRRIWRTTSLRRRCGGRSQMRTSSPYPGVSGTSRSAPSTRFWVAWAGGLPRGWRRSPCGGCPTRRSPASSAGTGS